MRCISNYAATLLVAVSKELCSCWTLVALCDASIYPSNKAEHRTYMFCCARKMELLASLLDDLGLHVQLEQRVTLQ